MAEPPAAAERSARRPLDERALVQVLRRLHRAPAAPWLHGEVARRMAERLPVIKQQPDVVLDWWAQLGGGREALRATYPRARIVAVEAGAPPAAEAAPWWSPRRWSSRGAETVAEEAVPAGGAQLVWANMMLHGAADPQAVMARWQRALAVDGFLMFSTLGPGSLERLSSLYRAQGWPPPLAPFVDMHDLGDMLVHAGFADPVMDQEPITLTWASAEALLAELRTLGGNVAPGRHSGLRTPRWRQRLLDALGAVAGADGRPALQFELVYGHAFRPPPRPRMAGETAVPLDDMRAMVRSGRKAG
jgi:malonyl-CoA O-methyltransferase